MDVSASDLKMHPGCGDSEGSVVFAGISSLQQVPKVGGGRTRSAPASRAVGTDAEEAATLITLPALEQLVIRLPHCASKERSQSITCTQATPCLAGPLN